ncbi:phospholipid scramblase 3-like [Haemaphysalis longicornis]
MDQFIFLAIEESDCRDRWFYCGGRPFDMRLLDYRNVPVLRFIRPLRCDCAWCFCCFCCLQELEVQAPKGTIIGSVRMDFSLSPSFSILDRRDKLVLKIKRPLCPCTFCGKEVLFNIFAPDGVTKLGHIIKLESRLSHNKLTSFDSFSLGFPIDLDVKMKAVLLGALMLIPAWLAIATSE